MKYLAISVVLFAEWAIACGSGSESSNVDARVDSLSIDASGVLMVSTVAGTGEASFADGDGANAKLNGPIGIAAFGNRVFVADELNHRIRMLECTGSTCTVNTIAGTGAPGFMNGAGSTAKFNHPVGVTVQAASGSTLDLLIADYSNHRVRKVSCAGAPSMATCNVETFAGAGTPGSTNGAAATATFNGPSGVDVAADGTIYVADTNSQKIRKITCAGTCNVETLAGTGGTGHMDGPAAAAIFNTPVDVAVDGSGAVFITEWLNMMVRKIDVGSVSTYAGTGLEDYVDGPIDTAAFAHPRALVFDNQHRLLIADQGNHRIRMIDGGNALTLAGSGMTGPPDFGGGGFADGPAAMAMFKSPRGIAIDGLGRIFISDTDNNRIRMLAYH